MPADDPPAAAAWAAAMAAAAIRWKDSEALLLDGDPIGGLR
jgi:hypothetical protein